MSVKRISNDAYEELSKKYFDSPYFEMKPNGETLNRKVSIKEDLELWEQTKTEPILLFFTSTEREGAIFWIYQNCLYDTSGNYTLEQRKLLILEYADKERQKFEKLKLKFESDSAKEIKYDRPRIPEEIRISVWRRDQGKCAQCGSRENLEYDHIIPVSKGGSTTIRNIELLCEKCNREKSNKIQ